MKIYYEYILDINKILRIYQSIRRNTKHKSKLIKFELFKGSNFSNILNILKNEKYRHDAYNIFKIYHPKERLVMSEKLNDKIVNQLISEYVLLPLLEPKLIDSNCATRKNKGSSYAINLFKKYINHYKINYDKVYVLKCDVSKFFYSIDHNILKEKLKKDIKDERLLKLIYEIVDSTNRSGQYQYNKGLGIGNQSSQILAIYYLNDLDHFIKEKLHVKCYCRYMDDLCLVHYDKNYLKYCQKEISNYLENNLLLSLNNKTNISELHHGVNFLGYRFILNNKRLVVKITNRNKNKIIRKIKKKESSLANYNGYLSQANVKIKIN